MEIEFLNVDLVIESSENLQLLFDELAENVFVMFNGEWENKLNRISLSIKDSHQKNADEIILKFVFLIQNLSPESKTLWDKCPTKRFDIGFESGDSPKTYETEIDAKTIEKIAKLGASMMITIYSNSE